MMTEDEWLAGVSAGRMLHTVNRYASGRSIGRKCRLLTCHLLHRLSRFAPDDRFQIAVEVAERHIEGLATKSEVATTVHAALVGMPPIYLESNRTPSNRATDALRHLLADQPFRGAYDSVGAVIYCHWDGSDPNSYEDVTIDLIPLIHDLFGNPFRPVTFAPSWRTSAVVALAQAMYESRDFAAMPVLADALEEAGCDHADILAHGRDPHGVHVRGCWVVDGLLGKA